MKPKHNNLLTVHESEKEVDTLAENALKAPPISADVVEVKLLLVSCVLETPFVVMYLMR